MGKNDKNTDAAPTDEVKMKEIKIQGVLVKTLQPYAEGHTINAAEAQALNQTRAEAIGNNRRKAIKELLEAEGATPESVADAAQALITEYDEKFVFSLATVGASSAKLDPLTKECRAIARNFVTGKLKENGVTRKQYEEQHGEDAFTNKVMEVAENPQVVAMAKENLAARERMAGLTL